MQSRASCQACTASGQLPKWACTSPSSFVASTCMTLQAQVQFQLRLQLDRKELDSLAVGASPRGESRYAKLDSRSWHEWVQVWHV